MATRVRSSIFIASQSTSFISYNLFQYDKFQKGIFCINILLVQVTYVRDEAWFVLLYGEIIHYTPLNYTASCSNYICT